MINLFTIVLVLAASAILAWNFIPAFREYVRGKSTFFEGLFAASFTAADAAVREFQLQGELWSSVVPEGAWQYVTIALALWMIFKRVITNTPFLQRD